MIRRRRPSEGGDGRARPPTFPFPALLAGVAWACSPRATTLDAELASEVSVAPRRAPGVVADPAPALPPPVTETPSDRGLAVVVGPRDSRGALDVVRSFFRATVAESEDELGATLDEHARIRTDARGTSHRAMDHWRQRFERLEYGALAGHVVFRERDVATFASEQVARLNPPRPRLGTPTGEDLLVVVPVSVPRIGRVRLYGDEISFLLRPVGTGYKIREMREEFELP